MHCNNNIVILVFRKRWQNVLLFLARFELHGTLDEILFHVANSDALPVQEGKVGRGLDLLLRVGCG